MSEWSPLDLLPGLYAGLCAILLGVGLRRWLDPVPWRVMAVFGAVIAVLFGPVLFGGRILLPLDNLRGHVPFQDLPPTEPHGNVIQGDLIQLVTPSLAAVREAFADGRWPLWNPRAGAGMPLLGDPQAQALQPLVWLTLPFPVMTAAGVLAALRVLCALVFTFLLFRRQGLAEGPALAGALGYGLGGFVLLWVGWPLANAAALLPFFLYAAVRTMRCGGRRDGALLAGAAFALLTAGHPEAILLAGGLGLAWLGAEAFWGTEGPREVRMRRLRRAAVALAAGAAVAAPAWMTALDLIPDSFRAARIRHGVELRPAGLAERWVPIAAPNAFGNSRYIDYWGFSNTNEDASGFVGTALLLAALAGLRASRRFPQERLTLAVTAAALVWLAHPPGFPESRRPLLLVAFGLSYLGACTLERLRRGEVRRWAVVAAGAALAALLVWAVAAHPDPVEPGRLDVLRYGWLHWQLRFLVLAVLASLAVLSGWVRKRWGPVAFALFIAAELVLAHGPANPPMPARLALPWNEPLRFLKDRLDKDPAAARMAALGSALPPNLASLYGIPDARVYNPMSPESYADFIAPVTVRWWGELPEFGVPGHPLYRQLGVRYLLTAPGEAMPPPFRRVLTAPEAWVWEQPDPLPLVYFAPGTGSARPALLRVDAEHVDVEVGIQRPRVLASRLQQDGGWLVLLDGQRHPTSRQGPFLASEVPPGRHRIELLYRPHPFLAGLIVAALGLALGAALWVPVPRKPQGD